IAGTPLYRRASRRVGDLPEPTVENTFGLVTGVVSVSYENGNYIVQGEEGSSPMPEGTTGVRALGSLLGSTLAGLGTYRRNADGTEQVYGILMGLRMNTLWRAFTPEQQALLGQPIEGSTGGEEGRAQGGGHYFTGRPGASPGSILAPAGTPEAGSVPVYMSSGRD
ncbi:MAG: hypothetical protein AAF658_06805, partial [Myxococcota bacterium]